MPRLDENQAECRLLTFKEGALSALAHDLELAVTRFTIEVSAGLGVDARFDARSLEVLHALRDGKPTAALSDDDKRKIERSIVDEVLDANRHPEIRFRAAATAEGDGFLLKGELTLCGRTRPLEIRARPEGARLVAEVVLHQPDFGIKPYRALLGALKVRADVQIRAAVPWPLPG